MYTDIPQRRGEPAECWKRRKDLLGSLSIHGVGALDAQGYGDIGVDFVCYFYMPSIQPLTAFVWDLVRESQPG